MNITQPIIRAFSQIPTAQTNFSSIDPDSPSESCEILPSDYTTRQVTFSSVVYTTYAIIFVVSLVGNLCVCYIVMQSPRMRTVTNYFILNLAIGDILISLLCVPFTSVTIMLQYWPFGAFMCPLVNYVSTLSVFVSAYTLVAISIDKWLLIIYPLKPRISKRFATGIIAAVWVFAGITVLPTGIFARMIQPPVKDEFDAYQRCDKYLCQEDFTEVGEVYGVTYTTVLMIFQYIIPLIVLIFTYTSIAAIIWCRRIPGEAENNRDRRMARSKRKMIKMMITVVLVFTMSWLPYNLFMLFHTSIDVTFQPYLYVFVHVLAMSHACYNPIIYFYMNTRFREGLCLILKTLPCCRSCYMRKSHGSMGSGFQHNAGIEGTDSSLLQRNNTFTTYITLNRKNNRLSTYQNTTRPPSLMRHNQHSNGINNSRRKKLGKDFADEPM
ncbi:RYamide receptor [Anthonomus grandis grandis]|uniref:RYamide receptor n=1 Tax=Anthonomus grandis grandis TaxID=2921223 RepID=UPI002165AF1A|nr:RYamide receptor [Anthonomus grandis grandis]XP_050293425.1 RYamide receptor [Anthonomus grandis grandis]